jgi:hypothetical protein
MMEVGADEINKEQVMQEKVQTSIIDQKVVPGQKGRFWGKKRKSEKIQGRWIDE